MAMESHAAGYPRLRPPYHPATMEIELYEDAPAVAARAADRIAEVVADKPDAVLLLPAGATPLPLYRDLVQRAAWGLDLSQAHLVQLDEIVGVAPEDGRGFHRFLREYLLDPIGHPAERSYLIDGIAPDPTAEIERHARRLTDLGGADLAVLGIGRNGHVAFNEPGSTLDDGGRLVDLAPPTLAGLEEPFAGEEVPTRGITLGLREIAASREVLILATGAAKAKVVRDLVTGPPTPALPASLLSEHDAVQLFVDAAAGAKLSPTAGS